MKTGRMCFAAMWCAACLALGSGAEGARGGVVRVSVTPGQGETRNAPIEAPMEREKVVRGLAEYSKRFVTARGVAATADAMRRLPALRPRTAPAAPLYPDTHAQWLSAADVAEIEDLYCIDPDLMDAAAYSLFVSQYGIECRYVLDDAGTEGDVLQCGDLDEVIAQLLQYPDEVLYYLGHANPKMQIRILAPGLTLMCGAYVANGCASWNVVSLAPHAASATVHETAHALQFLGVSSNQADPLNPLKGKKAEFEALFTLPPDLDAAVTYDNWLWGNPLDEVPPGYTDMYAVVNIMENFAQTCTWYVRYPEKFLMKAHGQAWDEEILLCLKYRFVWDRVFRAKSFTDLFPPSTAIVSLTTVDEGDGDGRIEPGEYFSMNLSIVPLYDLPGATHLRCRPWETTQTVIEVATSEFTGGLTKGKRYDFPKAFRYRLSPSFTGETNRTFMLGYYLSDGSISNIGWDFVPLNEQGYLLAWNTGVEPASTLVTLTSTMKVAKEVQWPASLLSVMDAEHTIYDASAGCFWVCPIYLTDSLLRVPASSPASFTSIPLDPAGEVEADEVADMQRNPVDGAFWLRTDCSAVVRLAFGAGGAVQRLVIDPAEFSEYPWEGTRDMAIDPATGKVWLVSENEIIRLSPSGQVELDADGFSGLWTVAPADGGGCWVGTDASTLLKISASGALQSVKTLDYSIGELIRHPLDGSLWAHAGTGCYNVDRLVRFSAAGTPLAEWIVPDRISRIIPSTTDATVFIGTMDPAGGKRYQGYGGPLHTTIMSPVEYCPFAYRAAQ